MIIVDEALRLREAEGNPVRVALSGAGFAAQGLILQLKRPTPGLRLSVVANRTMATIEQVLANLEITDYVVVEDEEALRGAIAADRLAVTTDPVLAASTPGTDVLVDATGEVEYAARVVLAGIGARKHIVLVNAELDATLGPILNAYLGLPNGPQLVMTALGTTGAVFVGLSGYALVSRRDFSFMGAFLMVGVLVAFLAGLGAIFFGMPGLSLAVSAMFVLLMSGLILYETSSIIHGGETNYIMATVTLYVAIYNLFTSLLHLLGVFSNDD